jgi:hypothetical protein
LLRPVRIGILLVEFGEFLGGRLILLLFKPAETVVEQHLRRLVRPDVALGALVDQNIQRIEVFDRFAGRKDRPKAAAASRTTRRANPTRVMIRLHLRLAARHLHEKFSHRRNTPCQKGPAQTENSVSVNPRHGEQMWQSHDNPPPQK